MSKLRRFGENVFKWGCTVVQKRGFEARRLWEQTESGILNKHLRYLNLNITVLFTDRYIFIKKELFSFRDAISIN